MEKTIKKIITKTGENNCSCPAPLAVNTHAKRTEECIEVSGPKVIKFQATINQDGGGSSLVVPDSVGVMEDTGLLTDAVIPSISGSITMTSFLNFLKTRFGVVKFVNLSSTSTNDFATSEMNFFVGSLGGNRLIENFSPGIEERNTQEQMGLQTFYFNEEGEFRWTFNKGLIMNLEALPADTVVTLMFVFSGWYNY